MEINKAKDQAENLVVKLRELVNTLRQSAPLPERGAKREQLKAIGDSVQQLQDKNVPVPEDLRRLQSSLKTELEKAEKHQVVLYFLKEQLSQILAEIGPAPRKDPPNAAPKK